jgi:hypothetical protein
MPSYWPGTHTIIKDLVPTIAEGQNNDFTLDLPPPPVKMGRPAGSPNILTRPLKELAAKETERCIAVLVALRDSSEEDTVRLAAANALLDRGHGKPRPTTEASDDGQVTIIISPKIEQTPDHQMPVVTSERERAV